MSAEVRSPQRLLALSIHVLCLYLHGFHHAGPRTRSSSFLRISTSSRAISKVVRASSPFADIKDAAPPQSASTFLQALQHAPVAVDHLPQPPQCATPQHSNIPWCQPQLGRNFLRCKSGNIFQLQYVPLLLGQIFEIRADNQWHRDLVFNSLNRFRNGIKLLWGFHRLAHQIAGDGTNYSLEKQRECERLTQGGKGAERTLEHLVDEFGILDRPGLAPPFPDDAFETRDKFREDPDGRLLVRRA